MRLTLLIYILITCFSHGFGQNLIVDPSFEEKIRCPVGFILSRKNYPLKYWSLPTKGTTDYMHTCGNRSVSIPKNRAGIQEARTGSGYVRALYTNTLGHNYVEYIQGSLSESLIEGEEYEIEFWVSLSEMSTRSASCIGAYLSDKKTKRGGGRPLKITPQIRGTEFVTNDSAWTKITGKYTASGGEKYIVIGAFLRRKEKNYKYQKGGNLVVALVNLTVFASYYIDDVSVTRIIKETIIPKIEEGELDLLQAKNQPIILKNITFEYNRNILKPSSYPDLDILFKTLSKEKSYHIELTGYTDSIGKPMDNRKLSEERAEAVGAYLIDKGISKDRITCIGLGSGLPIASNKTEEGRQKNRRVELRVIE